MAVRTLDQIIAEIQGTYQPQIDTLRQRQSLIPDQIRAEEQGLQAKQEQAFGDILSGARRRGMGFSGIPLAEQARYTSTEFLPALARLKQSGQEQAMSLEDAINQIYERRNTLAQQLQQQDYQRDLAERQFQESIRQFNEQQAAQRRASAASSSFSPTLNTPESQQSQKAFYSLKDPKNPAAGFNFTDASGKPISAATYANLTGIPLSQLVKRMADAGDRGAQQVLGLVRDTGFVGGGVVNPNLARLIQAFSWR